ncbi:MAG: response regulator [Candidatus Zixiibacteriota bacterium]|nr:MAG: response regulator [candidate division Zixibacteria bacterium]
MSRRQPDNLRGSPELLTDASTTTILMVEDNPDHAHLARTALEKYGFWMIDIANTMAQAFRLMKLRTYQVLLVDYCLPDGYGIDLLDWVDDNCTVVMMTAQGSEKVAADAFKRGALDYVVKDSLFREVLPEIVMQAMAKNEAIKKAIPASGIEPDPGRKSAIAYSQNIPLLNGYIHSDHLKSTIAKARRHLAEIRGCLRVVRYNPEEPPTETQVDFLESALEDCEVIEELIVGIALKTEEEPSL